jgi:hypothetical protein
MKVPEDDRRLAATIGVDGLSREESAAVRRALQATFEAQGELSTPQIRAGVESNRR